MTGYKNPAFRLVFDPCEDPLSTGLELTFYEIIAGIRQRSFVTGTVLCDVETGLEHTIIETRSRLALRPPCARVDRYFATIARLNAGRNRNPNRKPRKPNPPHASDLPNQSPSKFICG